MFPLATDVAIGKLKYRQTRNTLILQHLENETWESIQLCQMLALSLLSAIASPHAPIFGSLTSIPKIPHLHPSSNLLQHRHIPLLPTP